MLIAIPVCEKDVALVLKNLAWCDRLGAPYEQPCLVTHDDGFDAGAVIDAAAKRFKDVKVCRYSKWKGEQKWPTPQNWAWQNTARYIESHKLGPWFWWEADATPLKANWPATLEFEHRNAGKAFMGYIVDEYDGHMNGVGCYPANISDYTINGMLCRAAAFDIVMRDDVRKNVHRANHLIQWTPHEVSFPTLQTVKDTVHDGAIIFHKCKDGSLAERLSETIGTRVIQAITKAVKPSSRIKPVIPITCHLDASSGYGTYSVQVIQEFLKRSYTMELRSPSLQEFEGTVPDEVKRCITKKAITNPWEFIIYPCVVQPADLTIGKHDLAYLTMWESTRLVSQADPSRTQAVNVMNKCKVVMVPNVWNLSTFSSCGVDTPMRVVPLGVDMKVFQVFPNDVEANVFIFGTAARTKMGGVRKGFNAVVQAFQKAFPRTDKNVRLLVKCFPDDPALDTSGDNRVEITRKYLSVKELAEWYKRLNVFVSGSASEGWGRHQQEAMCCGRPVVGIDFGGVREFFNQENGYACEWTLEPAEGIYRTMGHYAKPSVESMAEKMREAYEDRIALNRKVNLSIASARRFSIPNSVDCIVKVLKEFKMLP